MLVTVRRRKLFYNGDESLLAKLWPGLAKAGFDGTVYGARSVFAEKLGIDLTSKKNAALFIPRVHSHGFLDGDLFKINGKGTLYLLVNAVPAVEPRGRLSEDAVFEEPGFEDVPEFALELEAGEVALFGDDTGPRFDQFCEAVQKLAKSGEFEELPEAAIKGLAALGDSAIEPPSESDLEVANVLRDSQVQDIIVQLKDNPSGLVVDDYLANRGNAEEMEYYLDKLLEVGLISEELAVFCKKTGQPTIRVKNRSALDQLSAAGVKCSCGQKLTSEDAKRLVLFDAENSVKFDSTWVFRVFLVNYLLKVGISREHIRSRSAAQSEDRVLYVSLDGQLLVFYLSGDALTSDKVSELVAGLDGFGQFNLIGMVAGNVEPGLDAVLANSGSCDQFVVLRSVDELNAKLIEVFEKIRTATISALLKPLSDVRLADVAQAALQRIGLTQV